MNTRSFLSWNFKIFRAFGVDVRIHWLLIFFLILQIVQACIAIGLAGLLWSPVLAFILFFSILLHEYGHCAAARRVGGSANEIILWPLGGLARCSCPSTPKAELITSFGGPFVNILLLVSGYAVLKMKLLPFSGDLFQYLYSSMLLINRDLLLFNLIPCYPLDGGRIFKALLWPVVGLQKSIKYTMWLALVFSILLFIYAFLTRDIFLAIISILVFWQAWSVVKMKSPEAGSLFLEGSCASAERYDAKPTVVEKLKSGIEQKRIKDEKRKENAMMESLDRILDKINRVGVDGLTGEERQFLDATSEFLKKRGK